MQLVKTERLWDGFFHNRNSKEFDTLNDLMVECVNLDRTHKLFYGGEVTMTVFFTYDEMINIVNAVKEDYPYNEIEGIDLIPCCDELISWLESQKDTLFHFDHILYPW